MVKKSTTKDKQNEVSFLDSLKNFWIKAFDVNGVATRSEYWYAIVFYISIYVIIQFILEKTIIESPVCSIMLSLFYLIYSVPKTSLDIRRWHDIGMSGFLFFIPFVLGSVTLFFKSETSIKIISAMLLIFLLIEFVLFCLPSKLKNNKYRK